MSNCSTIAIQTRPQIACCNTVIYIFTYCFITNRVQGLVEEGRIHKSHLKVHCEDGEVKPCLQALTGKKEPKQTFFFGTTAFVFQCSIRASWCSIIQNLFFFPIGRSATAKGSKFALKSHLPHVPSSSSHRKHTTLYVSYHSKPTIEFVHL